MGVPSEGALPRVAVGINPSRAALQIATLSASGERRREHRVPLSPAAVEQLEAVLAGEPAIIAMEGSHSTGQLFLFELLAQRHDVREVHPVASKRFREALTEDHTDAKDAAGLALLAHALDHGPATCATVADRLGFAGCRACPHVGRIASPISLGATAAIEEGNSAKFPGNSAKTGAGAFLPGNANSANSANSATGVPTATATDARVEPAWGVPDWVTGPVLPAFPVAALPPWMATHVRAVADETQTPPDLAALLGVRDVVCGCRRVSGSGEVLGGAPGRLQAGGSGRRQAAWRSRAPSTVMAVTTARAWSWGVASVDW
jgi:hypothetical protein